MIVPADQSGSSGVRLAELMASLSVATDLGMGQPLEFALCSCLLAMRLGDALGLGEGELTEVYYQALLRYIGCNAESSTAAALIGDEILLRKNFATVDPGHPTEMIAFVLRTVRQAYPGQSSLQLARQMARGLLGLPHITEGFAGHCEVAQRLAQRFGFSGPIVVALGQLYERWDGKGLPNGLRGEQISPAVRVVALAQDAVIFHRLGGVDAAVAMARERKGTAHDPSVVERFCDSAPQLLAGLEGEPTWETVLALEPGPHAFLSTEQLDTACRAIADFADLKSPFTLNHSSGVAELAASAARRCGLPEQDAVALRRAGWLHDVGRVGISAGIWEKPGPFSEREWEQVRLHPYYTERILARTPELARLGALAALHHERLDGSGYHRGLSSSMLSPAARILAAADLYHRKTEPRPHRQARPPEQAAREVRQEARGGRLDAEAVEAVLAAAGHHVRPLRRYLVAGLSTREVEVLRFLARGQSIKQIASRLFIAPKTVDNHVQHVYAKIGVSTRAGATLFAMEHDLMASEDDEEK